MSPVYKLCAVRGCGRIALRGTSRCPTHPYQRAKTAARGYGSAHQRRARAAIAAQPWCSECRATSDLTADHSVPIAKGGLHSPLVVLCRSCNSTKGART